MTSPDSLDGLIARLRVAAICERDLDQWCPADSRLREAASAIEQLREERDAALVDAKRYRWLREPGDLQAQLATLFWASDLDEKVDAVIAALAAEPKDGSATAEVKAFIEGLEK